MQNLQLKLACYFFRLRLPFCDFVYIYLKIKKGRKPFSDLWFLRLPPSGLSPTSKNESTPYDVNFSYCLFLGMNVWQYSRNQEQELWSSIFYMYEFILFFLCLNLINRWVNHSTSSALRVYADSVFLFYVPPRFSEVWHTSLRQFLY